MLKKTIKMLAVIMFLVTAAVVLVPDARAQEKCNLQTVKGRYGVIFNGSIIGLGPFTAVGVYTFDGNGNFSGTEEASFNGSPFPGATLTGTYALNEDCTGTITATIDQGGFSATLYMVIVDNGKEAYLTQKDPPGTAFTGILRRQ